MTGSAGAVTVAASVAGLIDATSTVGSLDANGFTSAAMATVELSTGMGGSSP